MQKKKAILFVFLLAINLAIVGFFKLKITVQDVFLIHIFLFSLLCLTDLMQIKLLEYKKASKALLLSMNFFRMFVCVVFLLPVVLNYSAQAKAHMLNFFLVYFFWIFSDIFLKQKA